MSLTDCSCSSSSPPQSQSQYNRHASSKRRNYWNHCNRHKRRILRRQLQRRLPRRNITTIAADRLFLARSTVSLSRTSRQVSMANTYDIFGLTTAESKQSTNTNISGSKGPRSVIRHPAAMHICGDMFSHIHFCNAPLSTPLGYTRFAKGLEATGEG